MVKYKYFIFFFFILFFLAFSLYPTYFELSRKYKLVDKNRVFVLEHNYYWPDYNLYLSKIRQGMEGRFTAIERYTSEPHQGSLIQIFYVLVGQIGRLFGLTPTDAYLWGRILLSLGLLITVLVLSIYYFNSFLWRLISFLIVLVSGSFPRFYSENGVTKIGRFMEWWSNIDAVQRITFIPHILAGQVLSFFLLYKLTTTLPAQTSNQRLTMRKLLLYILLGNLLGIIFPPSLMTLLGVLFFLIVMEVIKRLRNHDHILSILNSTHIVFPVLFILGSMISLLYTLALTRNEPWATLVSLHRNNHFIIPFGEFILATGPIFYLGLAGIVSAVLKRDKKFFPLVYWCITTFIFLIFYTYIKDQSPLRFTQTGLFIPLGIFGAYFLHQMYAFILKTGDASEGRYRPVSPEGLPNRNVSLSDEASLFAVRNSIWDTRAAGPVNYGTDLSKISGSSRTRLLIPILIVLLFLYISGSLFMMKNSLDWQTSFITQRINASIPLVPYPPQTMYPPKAWMDGIVWLDKNTTENSVVLSEVTAGNYIPAYSHNSVYFGQANTVAYDRKQAEATKFFSGKMTHLEAKNLFTRGHITYIFESVQEREKSGGKSMKEFYPLLKEVYKNTVVTIYSN